MKLPRIPVFPFNDFDFKPSKTMGIFAASGGSCGGSCDGSCDGSFDGSFDGALIQTWYRVS